MSDRHGIFQRLREALSVKARSHHGVGLPTVDEHRAVLPRVGGTPEEWVNLFSRNAADLHASLKRVKDAHELSVGLKELATAEGWKSVATHRSVLAEPQAAGLKVPLVMTDRACDKAALERCDVGITECDALVAQTGSVLVTSRTAGGRALSCLPPHHVVLARRDQIVPDLPAAFALLKQRYHHDFPSMISFITGPSRTGDIERILVLGAHGPRKLTLFILD